MDEAMMDDAVLRTLCPHGQRDTRIRLLVDTSQYGVPGWNWCSWWLTTDEGTGAVYPFKVRVPGKGIGQYKASEVRGWRTDA